MSEPDASLQPCIRQASEQQRLAYTAAVSWPSCWTRRLPAGS
jgi:hypothetical protein